ncbi:DUF6597 domain-containing transcriptional factor [Alkalitalea saponilacus]|uniref:DUF6597 domain-containing protein n=1 Tax=Alkalitalea saponilacus TaxID=889453 RepID=A0A1T5BUI0_9BACT|nr:DUF6597 domain-containing transcriptional factor [Alkalitalea saponilacus]ASB49593.1 hypothetical protein CDL62_10790 [Alkalitalea saponilacus]SKB50794.1 hypothetical protein SAMN03080601_00630 [Alkalitalea saponilacus]
MQKTIYQAKHQDLKQHITDYWHITFSESTPALKLPPLGMPVMLFQYGEESDFYNLEQIKTSSIIVGQFSKHMVVNPTPKTRILGVNFKPYGLYNLFGISPKTLFNTGVPLNTLFPKEEIGKIEVKLKNGIQIESVIDDIERMLLSNKKEVQNHNLLDSITDKIIARKGIIDQSEILNGKINARTLQRYFSKTIGISCKMFCRILRHKYILELIYQNPEMRWDDPLFLEYYYDFSHFRKDFITFSQTKPVDFKSIMNNFTKSLLE